MKIVAWAIVFSIFFIPLASADVMINEVMNKPANSTNYEYSNEWLELYNNGLEDIDLSNATVCGKALVQGYVDESNTTKMANGFVLKPKQFALVTNDYKGTIKGTQIYGKFTIPSNTLSLHIKDNAKICSYGLSNSDSEEILFSYIGTGNYFNYSSVNATSVPEGQTMQKDSSGKIIFCAPTPGTENCISNDSNSNTDSNSPNGPSSTNNSSQKNICTLQIHTDGYLFKSNDNVNFKINVSCTENTKLPPPVYYWVEDFSGVRVSSMLFKRMDCTDDEDYLEGLWVATHVEGQADFTIRANVSEDNCNTVASSKITVKEMVLGSDKPLEKGSKLQITSTYPEKIKLNSNAEVQIHAYRGDSNEGSFIVYIESTKGQKLTNNKKTEIETKYTYGGVTIQLPIPETCIKDNYVAVAEGFEGVSSRKDIVIEGCTPVKEDSSISPTKTSENAIASESIEKAETIVQELPYKFDYPSQIMQNEEFPTIIELSTSNAPAEFKVYSYVYDGEELLSEGLGLNGWKFEKNANEKLVSLGPNTKLEITLKNRLIEGGEKGTHKYKIVVNDAAVIKDIVVVDSVTNEEQNIDSETNSENEQKNVAKDKKGFNLFTGWFLKSEPSSEEKTFDDDHKSLLDKIKEFILNLI